MSITIHPHKKAEIKMNALKRRKEKYWPERTVLEKPQWLRKVAPSADRVEKLVKLFADKELHTVCQEASCPNLVECFDQKIATFMILGSICTRRCSFCDVAHGIPLPVDRDEPARLARTVMEMGLKYVVITSVDRDDLPDGGAQHFVNCIKEILACNSDIKIECLVPDFKKKQPIALECFRQIQPNVMNHNVETVRSLYPGVRPGSDYDESLALIAAFKKTFPNMMTKSGLMLGMGESEEEIKITLSDLRKHQCDSLTLGQYLPPSQHHYPLVRYVSPDEFAYWRDYALQLGFMQVASGPFVRSSYQAEVFARSLC